MKKKGIRIAVFVLFVFSAVLVGCYYDEITRDVYDQIRNGMTENQVIELIGSPDMASETYMGELGTMTSWLYQFDNAVIMIIFENGRVSSKSWTDF